MRPGDGGGAYVNARRFDGPQLIRLSIRDIVVRVRRHGEVLRVQKRQMVLCVCECVRACIGHSGVIIRLSACMHVLPEHECVAPPSPSSSLSRSLF